MILAVLRTGCCHQRRTVGLREEVMCMGFVTYEALFGFVVMLCAIISLVLNQRNK